MLSTTDDLVAAELNDNNAITHILSGGTSDFKLIRDALGPGMLLDGDATDAVPALKADDGKDLLILGSGDLVRSLMQASLIDEYILLIHPLPN